MHPLITFAANDIAIGDTSYTMATWLFLRCMGIIYFAAFASMYVQILGLIGSQGILPVAASFPAAAKFARCKHYFRRPCILVFGTSDRCLRGCTLVGMIVSVMVVLDVATLPALVICWILYLSLIHGSGVFFSFQWDILLVEVGALSILLAPMDLLPHLSPQHDPYELSRWLAVFLLFRLVFASGVVKLRSGCPAWRSLTAMCYHYETQPLPNRFAWYAHQLPLRAQKISTFLTLAIELIIPFGLFVPGPVSQIAALCIVGLMLLIIATGNYCFFNLLTIALCLLVFDDATLQQLLEIVPIHWSVEELVPAPISMRLLAWIVTPLLVLLTIETLVRLRHRQWRLPKPWGQWIQPFRPWMLVNNYGLFATMTTKRPEIIIEGSVDGQQWHTYEFKWKPGKLNQVPRFIVPHQPRVDWQMWFAALGNYKHNIWLLNMMARLLLQSPQVSKLLKHDPFTQQPAQFIRATVYQYHFTTRKERRETGNWWKRTKSGAYAPVLWRPPGTRNVQEYQYYLGND